MADLTCCGGKRKAEAWRLVSADSSFLFQRVYQVKRPCPGRPATDTKPATPCGMQIMQWRGEDAEGKLSEFYDIDQHAQAQWLRRTDAEEARPEAQLMSEWAERMARPADVAIQYHTELCRAHRWYKGERVKT